jgi:hypothetical protein
MLDSGLCEIKRPACPEGKDEKLNVEDGRGMRGIKG